MIDNRSVQRFLKDAGFYTGNIDGDFAAKSLAASRALLARLGPTRSTYSSGWPDARVRHAIEQAMLESIGQDPGLIDGVPGPRTQIALERWQDWLTFHRAPLPDAELSHLPTAFPRQKDALAFYGEPGTNHCRITPPYQVYYAGAPVKSILINMKCAERALAIMEDVKAEYGADRIHELQLDDFGGCFNNRTMRNGQALSMHALACAWDWDVDRNGLRLTDRQAQFAKPEYRGFIDAHYRHGWISLGRERNFDWMHFQAARL